MAQVQKLVQEMTKKCFQKCIYKPGYGLAASDLKCLNNCADSYMDTVDLISKELLNQQESA